MEKLETSDTVGSMVKTEIKKQSNKVNKIFNY